MVAPGSGDVNESRLEQIVVQEAAHQTRLWFWVSIVAPRISRKYLGVVITRSCCEDHATENAVRILVELNIVPEGEELSCSIQDMAPDVPKPEFREKFLPRLEIEHVEKKMLGMTTFTKGYFTLTPEEAKNEPPILDWYMGEVSTLKGRKYVPDGMYFTKAAKSQDAMDRIGLMHRRKVGPFANYAVRNTALNSQVQPCAAFADRHITEKEKQELYDMDFGVFLATVNGTAEKSP